MIVRRHTAVVLAVVACHVDGPASGPTAAARTAGGPVDDISPALTRDRLTHPPVPRADVGVATPRDPAPTVDDTDLPAPIDTGGLPMGAGLVLTEVMPFPADDDCRYGQGVYAELHNPGKPPVDLADVALGIDGRRWSVVPSGATTTVASGAFVVVQLHGASWPIRCHGVVPDASVAMDVPVDLGVWRVVQDGVIVDLADLSGMPWRQGVAMQAVDVADPLANDDVSGWCAAPSDAAGGALADDRGTPGTTTVCDPSPTSLPVCVSPGASPSEWGTTSLAAHLVGGTTSAAVEGVCTRRATACTTPDGAEWMRVERYGQGTYEAVSWHADLLGDPVAFGALFWSGGSAPCDDEVPRRFARSWVEPVAIDCPVVHVDPAQDWIGGCTEACEDRWEVAVPPLGADACALTPREARVHVATPPESATQGHRMLDVWMYDVDGDGRRDLLIHRLDSDLVGGTDTFTLEMHHGVLSGGELGYATVSEVVIGSPSFGPIVRTITAADLDGDGAVDLAGALGGDVRWMRGPVAAGGRQDWQTTSTWSGTAPPLGGTPSVVAADLDGDGAATLVVASAPSSEVVLVDVVSGSGTSLSASAWLALEVPSVWPVQLDADVADELVVYDAGAGRLLLFDGPDASTPATDAVATVAVSDVPTAVVVAEVTGDGAVDLVIGAPGAGLGGEVWVVAGPLSGSLDVVADLYARWTTPDSGAGLGTSLVVADLDGDGADELVVGAPSADHLAPTPCFAFSEEMASVGAGTWAGEVGVLTVPVPAGTSSPPWSQRWVGDHAFHVLGAVVGAEDLDGDGADELWIGGMGRRMKTPTQDLRADRLDLVEGCLDGGTP